MPSSTAKPERMRFMDQVDVMRVFMLAAESGSFRRGADESHVSKAQLCRAVASLDARMQTQLFTCATRKISLRGPACATWRVSESFSKGLTCAATMTTSG
ncbi:hypothetical protein PPGU19_096470 (plasmid) [Paraburkholderia sp. PGU19]|nr:hypothetical protein PPGU19_096470 [Paraburkholderia sp. PGU19]